jgi:hypothetical protein
MPTEPIEQPKIHLRGILADYLQAVTNQWLLVAPLANPGMLEIFSDRDTPPYKEMVSWSGEFAGKYLTSAVLVLRLSHEARLRAWLNEFVPLLLRRQDPDGYLGPWPRDSRLTNRSLHHEWDGQPWMQTWDTWAHYHLMLGLSLWSETGEEEPAGRASAGNALQAACRIADLICQLYLGNPSPRLAETGMTEMNLAPAHALAILYRKTGKPEYLQMAEQIVDEFSLMKEGEHLAGDYLNQALAGKEFYEMPRPRWESLHPVLALAELYQITGKPTYRRAFERIWWSIQAHDRHNNGGFSSGEQATGNPYDPRPIETCCTIAWIALSVEMLHLTGDPRVADEIEFSTLNSVLAMFNRAGRWATYNTPSNGARFASAHQIVFQSRPGSPELNCCSVNAPRGLGMVSQWAARQAGEEITLDYYGPGAFHFRLPSGQAVQLVQETAYPLEGDLRILVRLNRPAKFTLRLRIPGWSALTRCSLNGTTRPAPAAGTYLQFARTWQDGDWVDLSLDFGLRAWHGLRECEGQVSLYRGPLLLAFDQRYNRHLFFSSPPGESRERLEAPQKTASGWAANPLEPAFGSDPWNLQALALDMPAIDLDEIVRRDALAANQVGQLWDDWLPPFFLAEVPLADGRPARLCDYISAGQTGTLYRSWLVKK